MEKNQFTDRVRIQIRAGNGGDGMNSFKAYKGKPACGPDGGDGGDGGSVYFLGDKDMTDLLTYRFASHFAAENGERGGTNRCTGKNGGDVILKVPCGTVIKDFESGKIIADVFSDGEKVKIAEGGKGGKGNVRFTTARRHAPHFAQKGQKVKPHDIILEMKVIADVGIVGFPNVGKSTLLSRISAARPKIANYHFTTLSPNLGVVRYYEKSFIAADIPGLIEGAAQGAGLGHDFLRHIERTRMILHVVDISACEGRDPIEDFKKINDELKEYSEVLASLPQVVVCNKCDIPSAEENLKKFKKKYGKKYKIYSMAAISDKNFDQLLQGLFEVLDTLPPVEPIRPEEEFIYTDRTDITHFEIVKLDADVYEVTGGLVEMLCRNVELNDPASMAYFQKVLRTQGVIKELQKSGCKEGDTVIVGDVEFDFME
ncbi:MAG: GTPase ObgE [Clostridia bacterium]|nr:GTPase ObgE [Clostridia bacterium]